MLKADEVYLAADEFNIVTTLNKSEILNVVNRAHAGGDLVGVIGGVFPTAPFTHQMSLSLTFGKVLAFLTAGNSCALIDINYAPDSTSLFILHE